MFSFSLTHSSSSARCGLATCHHGTFETPNFMPVGTKASVKGIDVERLKEAGTQITLVNTYHLWLRPGHETIKKLGGIHKFSAYDGPILSDSGGYQVFSLESLRKITEEGVEFRSHLDGTQLLLTPELSVQIQEALGVDIAMAFDECPPAAAPYDILASSLERTIRWEKRCLSARSREETALFGITQGGRFKELRTSSAQQLSELPFDSFAIGGLSVGEPKEVMYEVLSYHPEQLPHSKIRYLMGVGTPEDIITAVSYGVDLFDCVMPTRSGRFGRAFVSGAEPYLNIRNARFGSDADPLDSQCVCVACRNYSRAYLHHLFRSEEMLGPQLLSLHNVTYYLNFLRTIRDSIQNSTFHELYRNEKIRWKEVSIGKESE